MGLTAMLMGAAGMRAELDTSPRRQRDSGTEAEQGATAPLAQLRHTTVLHSQERAGPLQCFLWTFNGQLIDFLC